MDDVADKWVSRVLDEIDAYAQAMKNTSIMMDAPPPRWRLVQVLRQGAQAIRTVEGVKTATSRSEVGRRQGEDVMSKSMLECFRILEELGFENDPIIHYNNGGKYETTSRDLAIDFPEMRARDVKIGYRGRQGVDRWVIGSISGMIEDRQKLAKEEEVMGDAADLNLVECAEILEQLGSDSDPIVSFANGRTQTTVRDLAARFPNMKGRDAKIVYSGRMNREGLLRQVTGTVSGMIEDRQKLADAANKMPKIPQDNPLIRRREIDQIHTRLSAVELGLERNDKSFAAQSREVFERISKLEEAVKDKLESSIHFGMFKQLQKQINATLKPKPDHSDRFKASALIEKLRCAVNELGHDETVERAWEDLNNLQTILDKHLPK